MGPAIFRQRYKPQMGQALPDDESAKKEGNERILRHAPLASFLPKNQVELSVDFRARDYHGAHRNTRIAAGTLLADPMFLCNWRVFFMLQAVSVMVSVYGSALNMQTEEQNQAVTSTAIEAE